MLTENWKWKRLTHEPVDNLPEAILMDIANAPTDDLEFIIGGDSQAHKGRITYITVLIMLYKGKGGRGYYHRHKGHKVSMKQKLYTETYEACEVAIWVNPILENLGYEIKEIHTDLNKDPVYPSNEMLTACMGLIQGYGFVGVAKPESWAAKTVADYFSKPKRS